MTPNHGAFNASYRHKIGDKNCKSTNTSTGEHLLRNHFCFEVGMSPFLCQPEKVMGGRNTSWGHIYNTTAVVLPQKHVVLLQCMFLVLQYWSTWK